MRFTAREKPPLEQRLANGALALLASSMLLVAAVFALAFATVLGAAWATVAVACVAIYLAQFRYLASIGRQLPARRLRIWQLSLLGHGLVFAAVVFFTGNPLVSLALMVPEVASSALHMAGIYHARKAMQAV